MTRTLINGNFVEIGPLSKASMAREVDAVAHEALAGARAALTAHIAAMESPPSSEWIRGFTALSRCVSDWAAESREAAKVVMMANKSGFDYLSATEQASEMRKLGQAAVAEMTDEELLALTESRGLR